MLGLKIIKQAENLTSVSNSILCLNSILLNSFTICPDPQTVLLTRFFFLLYIIENKLTEKINPQCEIKFARNTAMFSVC